MRNNKALAAILSAGLAAAGIIGTTPVMAAKVAPSATDTAPIVIAGVEEDAEVYAYQVVEGVYNKYGLLKYQQTAESKAVRELADIEKISDLDVTTLAKWAYTLDAEDMLKLTYDENTKTFSTDQALAGSYIVIVRKNYDDTKENLAPHSYRPHYMAYLYR